VHLVQTPAGLGEVRIVEAWDGQAQGERLQNEPVRVQLLQVAHRERRHTL
jgi:hypothetical protein